MCVCSKKGEWDIALFEEHKGKTKASLSTVCISHIHSRHHSSKLRSKKQAFSSTTNAIQREGNSCFGWILASTSFYPSILSSLFFARRRLPKASSLFCINCSGLFWLRPPFFAMMRMTSICVVSARPREQGGGGRRMGGFRRERERKKKEQYRPRTHTRPSRVRLRRFSTGYLLVRSSHDLLEIRLLGRELSRGKKRKR